MYSNGGSFGSNSASVANGIPDGPARQVPPWKFGVGPASMTDDRRD